MVTEGPEANIAEVISGCVDTHAIVIGNKDATMAEYTTVTKD